MKLVDPDGNYVISRFTLLDSNAKWEIRFHNNESRSFLNKIKYLPSGSLLCRHLAEHNPFGDYYYDSSMTDLGIVVSILFDVAGSVGYFGKIVNWFGTIGGIANTAFGNFSDEKQDKYRGEFLKSAGLMSDKYMTGYNPEKLKRLMDAVDLSIAYYFDKVEGTSADKGLNEYAKSLESTFKNEIIPGLNKK
ncbi:MAG: hypothetical protein WBK20_08205 [Spirochaetota bacterium]